MGIKGLQTYVEHHNLLRDFRLERGSELVVDGQALVRTLHQENTIRHGGEYVKCTQECECLTIWDLPKLNYTLYLMDGWDKKKYDEIIEKHTEKLNLLYSVSVGEDKRSWTVFTQECIMSVAWKFRDTVEIHTAPYDAKKGVRVILFLLSQSLPCVFLMFYLSRPILYHSYV